MKIYEVGGCVRDRLLGVQPKDFDYVVVGSIEQEMLDLGFQKVGKGFPVFLKDGREYALARKERKTGPGYYGFDTVFTPDVTLEQDLQRRDLTINSIAYDRETNQIIDPFNGEADLALGVLRHTSEAFAEDPVRVLRTARFAARYGFIVADETFELMRKIVHELDMVPQERIWAEFEKGLMEVQSYKMFHALEQCNAFSVDALKSYNSNCVDNLTNVKPSNDIAVRFALICDQFEDEDFVRCCIPTNCADLGSYINKHYDSLLFYKSSSREFRLKLLYSLNVFSRPQLIEKCFEVLHVRTDYGIDDIIREDIKSVVSIDAATIAAKCKTGEEIKAKLFLARLAVM